jgi:hypothetical protein
VHSSTEPFLYYDNDYTPPAVNAFDAKPHIIQDR